MISRSRVSGHDFGVEETSERIYAWHCRTCGKPMIKP
jgi:hypothetical protein